MSNTLCEMTIAEAARELHSRKVSPVELTEAVLDRIARLNPNLNAFITTTAELAMEQARAAEAEFSSGQYRGPLQGVPIAVKDLFYTRGIRTTAGSKILSNFVPDFDATVVEKLRQAGAVMVGKTALHEFAYGVTNDNPHFGPTLNPWKQDRTPGGSSGGSAVAVACGMSLGAMGTDTGGSIRIPASFCGLAGLKPTFGRVSLHGVYPLGYSMDHAGPLARTVEDVALVYDAIAGFDLNDDFSVDQPVREVRFKKKCSGIKIGVPEEYFFNRLQPDVERSVREALRVMESLGARVTQVKLEGLSELTDAAASALGVEAYVLHKKDLEDRSSDLGSDVVGHLETGRLLSAESYFRAQLVRQRFRRILDRLLQEVDVLVTPATPLVAFARAATQVAVGGKEESPRPAATRFTRCFNATGHPALALCCGFDAEGLPVGLQIVGKFWDEATVLHAGYAYEQATDWHKRRPPVG